MPCPYNCRTCFAPHALCLRCQLDLMNGETKAPANAFPLAARPLDLAAAKDNPMLIRPPKQKAPAAPPCLPSPSLGRGAGGEGQPEPATPAPDTEEEKVSRAVAWSRAVGRALALDPHALSSPAAGIVYGGASVVVGVGLAHGSTDVGAQVFCYGLALVGAVSLFLGTREICKCRKGTEGAQEQSEAPKPGPRSYTLRLDLAETFAGSESETKERVRAAIAEKLAERYTYVIVDTSALPRVPTPVIGAIASLREEAAFADVMIFVCGMPEANLHNLSAPRFRSLFVACKDHAEAMSLIAEMESEVRADAERHARLQAPAADPCPEGAPKWMKV